MRRCFTQNLRAVVEECVAILRERADAIDLNKNRLSLKDELAAEAIDASADGRTKA